MHAFNLLRMNGVSSGRQCSPAESEHGKLLAVWLGFYHGKERENPCMPLFNLLRINGISSSKLMLKLKVSLTVVHSLVWMMFTGVCFVRTLVLPQEERENP